MIWQIAVPHTQPRAIDDQSVQSRSLIRVAVSCDELNGVNVPFDEPTKGEIHSPRSDHGTYAASDLLRGSKLVQPAVSE